MLTSLDHVIVAVSDLAQATRAMATVLGRAPSWRGSHQAFGTANALFRVENTYLELLAPVAEGALADGLRARLASEGEGLAGLAFGTDDADACAAALRARGLAASDPQPGLGHDDESGAWRRWRTVWLPRDATRGVWVFAIQHESPAEILPPATAIAEPAACAQALDHVVVASGDLGAASTLYGDGLGLRLALDRTFPARGVRLLFFRVGGVTVELAGSADPAAPPRPADASLLAAPPGAEGRSHDGFASRSHDRLAGLAWRVADVDAARARLAAAEVDVSEVRPGAKPGTRVCTVRSGVCGVPTLLIGPDR